MNICLATISPFVITHSLVYFLLNLLDTTSMIDLALVTPPKNSTQSKWFEFCFRYFYTNKRANLQGSQKIKSSFIYFIKIWSSLEGFQFGAISFIPGVTNRLSNARQALQAALSPPTCRLILREWWRGRGRLSIQRDYRTNMGCPSHGSSGPSGALIWFTRESEQQVKPDSALHASECEGNIGDPW